MTIGRLRASQGGDFSSLPAVNFNRATRAGLVVEGGIESACEIAPFDIENRLRTDAQCRGDEIRVLTAMKKVERTGASLSASFGCANTQ